jgi:hypothetical protein
MAVPTISDVNELLKLLLNRELEPVYGNGQIEYSFRQPTRMWSSEVDKPTLNLFLYDVRKNKYRQSQWDSITRADSNNNLKAIQRRPPLRLDLHYMITAWGSAESETSYEDQYDLITLVLQALSRHPRLPDSASPKAENLLPPASYIKNEDMPPRLQHQPVAIPPPGC